MSCHTHHHCQFCNRLRDQYAVLAPSLGIERTEMHSTARPAESQEEGARSAANQQEPTKDGEKR